MSSIRDIETNGFQRQRRLYSFLFSKNVPPIPTADERKIFPEHSANIISRVFFWWLVPMLKVGYQRTLVAEDLFKLTSDDQVDTMFKTFLSMKTKWLKYEDRWSRKAIFTLILFSTFKHELSLSAIFICVAYIGSSLNPLVLRELIIYVENRDTRSESQGRGAGLAVGTALLVCFSGILLNHSLQKSMVCGAKTKAVFTKAIIEKSFNLSDKSKQEYPDGRITAMLGADVSRIDACIGYLPTLLIFPIVMVIGIVILIINIGVSALVGIAVLFLCLVCLTFSTSTLVNMRKGINELTDSRVYYISEVLNNLKMIKLYSWEIPYLDKIKKIRNLEMFKIFKVQALRNTVLAISVASSDFISMASFLTLYGVKGSIRNASGVFSSLSLFNILTQLVYLLPVVLSSCADAYVAIGRIGDFLECEEIELAKESQDITLDGNESLRVESGQFAWEKYSIEDEKSESIDSIQEENNKDAYTDETSLQEENQNFDGLKNINLSIKKGEFIVVTGMVGSGKTSLLYALAGIMNCNSGSLGADGRLIFCSSPWIQNATVRENILFGREFDAGKYEKVLSVCSMQQDIEMLTNGDQTEIGERGITLSGGQKARVNLARAIYSDSDIILMDDVLSAVDAKVGKDIMNQCIQKFLKNKTRILATHQLSLIGSADRVIFLNGDGTIDCGTLQELTERNPGFQNLMKFNKAEEVDTMGENIEDKMEESNPKKKGNVNKLMQEEDRAVNGVKFEIYKNYVLLGSGRIGPILWLTIYLSSTIFAIFCQLFSGAWLVFWIEEKFARPDSFYIGLYIMFTFLSAIFVVIEFICLVQVSNKASSKLHIMALDRILHSPMSFFDTTPLGRIMNRFSRDTEVLDNEISNQLRLTSYLFSTVAGVLILCVIYMPWFAIAIPVLLLLCISIVTFYQASAREVKRLEAIQRSFVYSSFGEILSGMETFRIYSVQDMFIAKFDKMVDQMNEAYFLTITNQRFLGVNLTCASSIFSLIIGLLCVFRIFNVSASSTGLMLSYVTQIANYLNTLMRSATQLENQMNSTERLNNYAFEVEKEAPYVIKSTEPNSEWPKNGEIVFENVSMSYRPELPLVLKDVNLKISPNEKIGICGRTGAGKSTITSALFRLVELYKGKIFIDNVDISEIGLSSLRSKLSIIPQDPVLFKGTVRQNLDPFNQSNDNVMLESLRKVGLLDLDKNNKMDEKLIESKFNLDSKVEDNGINYSLGEKQLISFARALVRESKVLILDEATSSIDYESDGKIQSTISEEFQNCTILCIAHRLKTILNYDRILVLDNGLVKEFDDPWSLFCQDGLFTEMCKKSNISSEDFTH